MAGQSNLQLIGAAGLLVGAGIIGWAAMRKQASQEQVSFTGEAPLAKRAPVAPVAEEEASEGPASVLQRPLLADPAAEPTEVVKGTLAFDQTGALVVRDPSPFDTAQAELVRVERADLERTIIRLHKDSAREEYWLDLVDGRRVQLEPKQVAAVEKALPSSMTYAHTSDGPD